VETNFDHMSLGDLTPDDLADRLYPRTRVHALVARPSEFSGEHVAQFRADGFVAVENVFTADEVEAAREGLSFLIRGGRAEFASIDIEPAARDRNLPPDQREPYVRKLMWFTTHDERLRRMSEHPRLMEIVHRLIGQPVAMIQDMALLKPPHVGREKPWHQDAAYFQMEPPELILGTWTALDAATADNGCMHVIPGSHLHGPRPHYHDRDCQLPDETIDVARDVMVPLSPGGVMLFSSLLHHGTPPNRSPARRRALQFHYAHTSCRKIDAAAHAQYFHDADGHAACTDYSRGYAGRRIEPKR
jgi:phytanoyl-CoA hydroxylase